MYEKEMISVIMSTYNEKIVWIENAVQSILNQTYSNIQLIIVLDNPMNDEIIRFVDKMQKLDNRIKIIKNATNKGLVFSLNEALRYATGSYIARMDADDFSYPNRLKEEIIYLKKNNLDLVGCETEIIDEKGIVINPNASKHKSLECIDRWIKIASPIAHPTWLAKRTVYEKLSGYRCIKYCEDYDFLIRAYNKGFKLGICEGVLFSYRHNNNSISNQNKVSQMLSAYYLRKNFHKLNQINQDKIDLYLNKKLNSKTINACILSEQKISMSRNYYNQKKYINSIFQFILGITKSRVYLINYCDIIKLRYLQKKYNKKKVGDVI